MQQRIVAFVAALSLVCIGLLARHHAAEAAHARESSGQIVHAQELADHHVGGTNAHLHESAAHAHAGECSLLAVLHAPLRETGTAALEVSPAEIALVVAAVASDRPVAIAGYRLAPKTSPPVA